MIILSLPYLVATSIAGSDWQFSGFLFGVEDGFSYLAKMLSGAHGAWLFKTPYSTAPQSGLVAFLPYLLLGKLTAPPAQTEQLVALFHLFRFAAGILAVLATYDFLALFIRETTTRLLCLLVAIFGGGLGWALLITGRSQWLGSLPLDFYSPETFGFLSLFGLPHLALARAGLLWTLRNYLLGIRDQGRLEGRTVLRIGGWWLVTALAQPLTALIAGFVMGAQLAVLVLGEFFSKRRLKQEGKALTGRSIKLFLLSGAIPAPFLLYNFVAFQIDPYLVQWTQQNIIKSPPLLHYLLAYGLVLPFALAGGWEVLRSKRFGDWLVVVWVIAFPLLAYAPTNLQRRLPEGMWVAWVALAGIGLERLTLFKQWQRGRRPVLGLWLVMIFLSSVLFYAGSFNTALNPQTPAFITHGKVRAFHYLADSAQPGDVLLASYDTSNAAPAYAPLRVLVGHGPESVQFQQRTKEVASFYSAETPDTQRLTLLREHNVRYVFWGPEERLIGQWDPAESAFLAVEFQEPPYTIFRVEAGR